MPRYGPVAARYWGWRSCCGSGAWWCPSAAGPASVRSPALVLRLAKLVESHLPELQTSPASPGGRLRPAGQTASPPRPTGPAARGAISMNRPLSRVFAFLLLVCMVSPARARPGTRRRPRRGSPSARLPASTFHKVLSRRLGRPLGALEPLALHSRLLPAGGAAASSGRGSCRSIPEGGYRPDADGVASASAWVTAGAVLAETPPERGRNHFFDPEQRAGLDDGGGCPVLLHAFRLALDGPAGACAGWRTGTIST